MAFPPASRTVSSSCFMKGFCSAMESWWAKCWNCFEFQEEEVVSDEDIGLLQHGSTDGVPVQDTSLNTPANFAIGAELSSWHSSRSANQEAQDSFSTTSAIAFELDGDTPDISVDMPSSFALEDELFSRIGPCNQINVLQFLDVRTVAMLRSVHCRDKKVYWEYFAMEARRLTEETRTGDSYAVLAKGRTPVLFLWGDSKVMAPFPTARQSTRQPYSSGGKVSCLSALLTIGTADAVRGRVRNTRADGVEIIGLMPNIAHSGYHVLYRGAKAECDQDLVEYYVECGLVARALDTNDRIRCIQEISHINPPRNPPRAPVFVPAVAGLATAATGTQTKAVWVRQLQQDGSDGFEFAGNAFKITGAVADIDDLKKDEDGEWKKAEKMSAPLRDSSEENPYGYIEP
eukprot:s2320_g8.t1